MSDSPSDIRAGVVSFLNALPLVEGLDADPRWRLVRDVPSNLAAMLDDRRVHLALLPVVDFMRREDRLQLISDGCIGCDGETMTVRVFSKIPPDRMHELRADPDSHTSVILARLIWRMWFDRDLRLTPYDAASTPGDEDAVLLIGDKVVRERPLGYGFEVDLGAAWRHLTGLPIVFAVWAGDRPALGEQRWQAAEAALRAARDRGLAHADSIAHQHAASHGWPVELAVHYMLCALRYRLDERMRAGMRRFMELARPLV